MPMKLEIVLDDAELRDIQKAAAAARVPVTAWVRASLVDQSRRHIQHCTQKKLAAVRAATSHRYPVADIKMMLKQIESGYFDRLPI
jgi:hypothetical protein